MIDWGFIFEVGGIAAIVMAASVGMSWWRNRREDRLVSRDRYSEDS